MSALGLRESSCRHGLVRQTPLNDGTRTRPSRRAGKSVFLLAVALGFIMPARDVGATSVRALGLEDLVQRAERIFLGQCVAVREVPDDSGQPVSEITFTIIERIKGVSGDRVTIRQFGRGTGLVPGYAIGQEVLLFLHPESPAGLTSPVGLGQGKFTIVRQGTDRAGAIAIGDGARAGRRALKRAISAPDRSTSAAAITIGNIQDDNGRGIELAPLIEAARRLVEKGSR